MNNVSENKNLKISASKIREKYRKLRKRKAANREKQINEIIEEFKLPKKEKSDKQTKQHLKQLKISQQNAKTLDFAKRWKTNIRKISEKIARFTFDKLKADPSSAAFAKEILDTKLLLKIKKL